MILATVILGIGHIGIHLNHYKKSVTEKVHIKKKVLKIISIFIGIIVVHSSASLAYKTYQLNELEKRSRRQRQMCIRDRLNIRYMAQIWKRKNRYTIMR